MPGFVSPYALAVMGNRRRPFPSAPLRTGLDTFASSGSPVTLLDGEERLSVLHFAYLHVPAIGSPTPLCHVSGFPGLRLLWGFRRPRARAP
jgi:hypothetical protein